MSFICVPSLYERLIAMKSSLDESKTRVSARPVGRTLHVSLPSTSFFDWCFIPHLQPVTPQEGLYGQSWLR